MEGETIRVPIAIHREIKAQCCVPCKKTISAPVAREQKGEKEAKVRALTGGWEETGVWVGRLEG